MTSAGRLVAAVSLAFLVFASAADTQQSPLRPTRKPLPGAPTAPVPEPPSREAAKPDLPQFKVGALLPLTGPSAWYAQEIRQGMALAAAEINAADADSPRLSVIVEVLDVRPLDVKDAADDFARLTAAGARVVFTASPTPTLAIFPRAAARDTLVVHQGLPSERFPSTSQTLLQVRPSAAARVEALAAYAWERGIRRLALLAAGDEVGKRTRAALAAAWQARGATLVHEESLSLDAPDLRRRLTHLARLAPEAVCLAFRGENLGDLARRVREAGYTGLLLGPDDDRAALLAAGPSLSDMVLLADAFVPEPDSRGARFAKAYEAKVGRSPSRFAANAYDTVSILADAARQILQDGHGLPGGARLRQALLARRAGPSIYGDQVRIRDDGTFDRPFALFRVERGEAVFDRHVSAPR